MWLKERILADFEKNPVLKTGFFECENRWNNTFNYREKFSFEKTFLEIKKNILKIFQGKIWNFFDKKKFFESKKIFIPWIKIWKFEDLKFWKEVVFEDFDIDKNWKEFLRKELWFEKHLWIVDKKWFPPIFICDNHNHVLESWKFFKWEKTQMIHIDQHRDNAKYLNPVVDFRRDLRICDYINFAIDEKWVSEKYISLCEMQDFDKYFEKNFFWNGKNFWDCEKIFSEFEEKFLWWKKIILNIDLDIFVDYQTIVNHQKIFELIKFLKNKVDLISIASSPLFLKKEEVFGLLKRILEEK